MLSTLATSSILLWIVVLINLLLIVGLIRRFNQISINLTDTSGAKVGVEEGSQAPDFRAETLTGEVVTLANYASKYVSLIFVSPHCRPCLNKIPELNDIALKAKQAGMEMVLVNTDGGKMETAEFVQKHDVKLPVLITSQEGNTFISDYRAEVTPSYCSINRDGFVEASGLIVSGWEKKLARMWANV